MKQKNSFSSDDFIGENESEKIGVEFPDFKHLSRREIYIWGIICGLGDSGASIFQQVGLVTVSADKASFIIGMYVVFVPLVTWLCPWCGDTGGGAVSIWSWISVSFSIVGLYLLSGCAEGLVCVGGAVGQGEFFVFVSMLFWVGSMYVLDTCRV
jgi:drug/metabolite transporter (DMT)-like permease